MSHLRLFINDRFTRHIENTAVDGAKYIISHNSIGHGSFGVVYKGRNSRDRDTIVAMKKVNNYTPGNIILREMRILKDLNHPNIVKFVELCKKNNIYYYIFEFCPYDLKKLMECSFLKVGHKKNIILQILNGLRVIQANHIVHRDLKPGNILVSNNGVIKLADFGSARIITPMEVPEDPQQQYTVGLVTCWYRPPEICLGAKVYGFALDMWSFGCVMAEILIGKVLLKGNGEIDQLITIENLCGPITPLVWPGVEKLTFYKSSGKNQKRCVTLYPDMINKEADDLLDKLLVLDPKARIDVDRAINHRFFKTNPKPEDLKEILVSKPMTSTRTIY